MSLKSTLYVDFARLSNYFILHRILSDTSMKLFEKDKINKIVVIV